MRAPGEVSVFIRATRTDESTYTPAVVHDRTKGPEVAGFSSVRVRLFDPSTDYLRIGEWKLLFCTAN
jgi:hypothetical protein